MGKERTYLDGICYLILTKNKINYLHNSIYLNKIKMKLLSITIFDHQFNAI